MSTVLGMRQSMHPSPPDKKEKGRVRKIPDRTLCCSGLSRKGNIINSVLLRHWLTLIIVSKPRIWGRNAMGFPTRSARLLNDGVREKL